MKVSLKEIPQKCACNGSTLTRFVQPVILLLLNDGPDHGYGLLQKLPKTALWRGEAPDPSGFYRALKDMEKRGLISSTVIADEETVIGKRRFAITDTGLECMCHWYDTLTDYRQGIDELIVALEKACNS